MKNKIICRKVGQMWIVVIPEGRRGAVYAWLKFERALNTMKWAADRANRQAIAEERRKWYE